MVVLGLVHVVNVPFQREFHFDFLCCFYLLFNSKYVAFFVGMPEVSLLKIENAPDYYEGKNQT
jgi:hypothetical protein